ncbi:MAG: hypothetical protein DIU71_07415 [Proteobacteria bacterium]|nr:MAG: hypothetical protein DIU71_07415 [Pseudomonadota bacterium]
MDPLTNLYERMRASAPPGTLPPDPPPFHEWLRYWNDNETDPGNLRNFEYWLSRRIPVADGRPARRRKGAD